MKKFSLCIAIVSLLASAGAMSSNFQLTNPTTAAIQEIQVEDTVNLESMRQFVVQTYGSIELYNAYVKQGYSALDAMMLTNWDVTEGLRLINDDVPENHVLKDKISNMRNSYKPAK